MAVISPPSYLQFGSHSAASDRLTVASLLQPGATAMASRGGVRPSGDNSSLQVAPQSTPNNTVLVKAGTVYIPEARGQGAYVCHNDASVTLTIAAASTTQNRRDLVVMQVSDQEVSGVTNTAALTVVQGTSVSGTATAPAVPSNAYALGEVSVPAGSTTVIAAANITDRRATAVAIGGMLPALSTSLPANPYDKMAVYCGDDDTIRVWSASAAAWRVVSAYPLPVYATAFAPTATQSITATVFGSLPTRQFVDFTAAKPMYVLLNLGAWLQTPAGTDLRVGIALTNATVGPGVNGMVLQNGSSAWGDIIYNNTGSYVSGSISIPYLLNAGTTRVEAAAYRSNTTGTPTLNYPVLRVVPLRYA